MTEAHEKHTEYLKKKLALSGTRREDWWDEREGGRHEVTFAFDPFTRLIVMHASKDADGWKKSFDGRRWVTGTIDWLQRNWVDDLKTGSFPVDPTTSRQLRTYQCVPWLLQDCPYSWDEPVSITQWAKYPLGGRPVRTWHELNGFDLEEHLDALCWTLAHPNEVNPTDGTIDEYGEFKMSPCAFCECRVTHPASQWMENYQHRTLPFCGPGLLKRIVKD